MRLIIKILGTSLILFLYLYDNGLHAQVGIGTNTPSEKVTLEVSSQINGVGDYKGLMPPKVPTEADRDNIPTLPADKGLIVFVVTTNCLDMYNGTDWGHIKCF